MPDPDPAELLTSAMVDAGAQAIADAERDLADRPIRQYPVSWRRTITVAALQAAAPLIAAAERERIAAWLRRAAAGRREYAERTPASHEVTPWLELAASCLESAAQLITDPQTMLDVIPSWRWTEDEIAALYGKDGSDAPPA